MNQNAHQGSESSPGTMSKPSATISASVSVRTKWDRGDSVNPVRAIFRGSLCTFYTKHVFVPVVEGQTRPFSQSPPLHLPTNIPTSVWRSVHNHTYRFQQTRSWRVRSTKGQCTARLECGSTCIPQASIPPIFLVPILQPCPSLSWQKRTQKSYKEVWGLCGLVCPLHNLATISAKHLLSYFWLCYSVQGWAKSFLSWLPSGLSSLATSWQSWEQVHCLVSRSFSSQNMLCISSLRAQ